MTDTRAELLSVSRERLSGVLAGSYTIRMADAKEWKACFDRLQARSFGRENIHFGPIFTEPELERMKALDGLLGHEPLVHHVLIEQDGEPVGCFWGEQEVRSQYCMVFTIIDAAHQGRGLYGAFLRRLMAVVGELGFAQIYSRHHADNNRVLVPKLKAGFVISSFEIAPRYGLLVHLRYYFNKTMQTLYAYRVDGTSHAVELRDMGVVQEKSPPR